MADDIREKAQRLLAKVPAAGVRSNVERDLFKELTNGVRHEDLVKNWEGGGIRTVCIDFVCWYAAQMGIDILGTIPSKQRNPKVDGFFNLEQTLRKAGKGHAFVRATADGPRPKYGDILRHAAFHVDICVGFDSDVLLRIAGGQSYHPRPATDVSKEFDNIVHVPNPRVGSYDASKLLGWLDIEKFFAAVEQAAPDAQPHSGSLWLNGNGGVVHPDAPIGAGGFGYFRTAHLYAEESLKLPHPASPAARTLDPLHVQKFAEELGRSA